MYEHDLQSIVDDFHVEPYTILPAADNARQQNAEEKRPEDIMAKKIKKPEDLAIPIPSIKHPTENLPNPVKELNGFDKIWENIIQNSGNTFVTKEGFEFTYSINHANLLPSLQGWDEIPRADFEMANAFGTCRDPDCYGGLFLGKKVIWAILHDERINR